MGEDLPARVLSVFHLLGIDGHHDGLGAETLTGLPHELGPLDRRRVDGHLVRARVEHAADILDHADAAAHGQRDEYFAGHLLHHMDHGVAVIGTGGDVEESDLVGTLLVIAPRHLDRVPGIPDVDEPDPLHHPAGIHVQTGYYALRQPHGITLRSCWRASGLRRNPAFPRKWRAP